MILANIFYVMAIIFMTLIFIVLIALVVAVFYIKNKIDKIHREITERIDSMVRPAETVMDFGASVAQTAATVIKRFTHEKKEKSKQ